MRARPHAGRYWGFSGPVLGPAFAGRNRRAFVWFTVLRFGLQVPNPTSGGGRFAAKRDSQPRVQFGGASAGVLDAPDGHWNLAIKPSHYSTAQEQISRLLHTKFFTPKVRQYAYVNPAGCTSFANRRHPSESFHILPTLHTESSR